MKPALRIGRVDPVASSFFEFRRAGPFPAWVQALAVVALWVATVLLTHREYRTHGTSFGYPGPAVMLLFVPIYEELIFRGWILSRLVRSFSNSWAIALSSGLFGLWHLKNIFWKDLEQLVGQMGYTGLIFGPIAAWLTLRFRTLWPAVILHFANNLFWTYVWN